MEDSKRVGRRRHAAELKQQVRRAQNLERRWLRWRWRTASMATFHKWRRAVDTGGVDLKNGDRQGEFVSLTLAPGSTVASATHLERYKRGPMILTGNQRFGAWDEVVGDRIVATAIREPLLHRRYP